MISPRVDRLLENVDSPYASVIVAAKRARQINSCYHNLGEGTFEEFPPPMVDTGSKNYLTIALEEVASGKVKYRYRGQYPDRAMARILLGVTGGIAAYKALELTRLAIKAGHAVRIIQTPSSTRFVGAASFAGITGAPVLTSDWEDDPLRGAFPGDPAPAHVPIGHLELVERADVYAIAPASANTIAKLAGGHADNLLTAAALACRRPLIIAPAMNAAMYEHPATQANLALLRERGATVLEPGTGSLASLGEEGVGRLPEPPELLAAIERALQHSRALDGLRVLVTAGGTREPIDAVRFVGNRSSGRMGFALAEAAAARGASVTVIAANVALPRRAGIEYVDVTTAAELAEAAASHFERADVLLMAASVADYRPADPHAGKLKKD